MLKPRSQRDRSRREPGRRRPLSLESLEARQLLAPVVSAPIIPIGTITVRFLSSQRGRIEADPTGSFGSRVFAIPRDTTGTIFAVNPNGETFATSNFAPFGALPVGGGSLGFGGYENWYDLAFDDPGTFAGEPPAGVKLFVSQVDSPATIGPNPRNAIYQLNPNGGLATANTFFDLDGPPPVGNGILDDNPATIGVAPGDNFGTDLYSLDVRCDGFGSPAPDTTCTPPNDGNDLFRIAPSAVIPQSQPAPFRANLETDVPLPNTDIDARALVFDPNRGIVLGGNLFGGGVQLFGGMFIASSDIESTQLSRIIQIQAAGGGITAPVDFIPQESINNRLYGDASFDPIGFFGGGLFVTDYDSRSLLQINVNPLTGAITTTVFATNFNVCTPTGVRPAGCPPLAAFPNNFSDAYRDAFSVTFSADGSALFVSDRDGIWKFAAPTLANTVAGGAIGLTELRQIGVPYTGRNLAAAVLDSGVDSTNLAFQGTVTPGFDVQVPGRGDYDLLGHGTAVAGIIHQIAPDSLIVPVRTFRAAGGNVEDGFDALRYVRDNPFVDNPNTFAQEQIPIAVANMSWSVGNQNYESERHAFEQGASVVIPYKNVLEGLRSLGIVPIAAAGNCGVAAAPAPGVPTSSCPEGSFNAMDGTVLPAVLNETVEVIADYPYSSETAAPPQGCVLETGDNFAFPGKIAAFSNRNVTSDYAAPGTCVSTFLPTGFVRSDISNSFFFSLGPLDPIFNGTSASAAILSGAFLFGRDAVSTWTAVASAGGVVSPTNPALAPLYSYLVSNVDPSLSGRTFRLAGIPSLAPYLNQDGINAILQWTAIPVLDANIGETFARPQGIEDIVIQDRLIGSNAKPTNQYRTYSHVHLGRALSAIEGTIALSYFRAHPTLLAQLAAEAGVSAFDPADYISANDIETFLRDATKPAAARAMARLLGGNTLVAYRNRLTFLESVADVATGGTLTGGIFLNQISPLLARLLPSPTAFPIVNREAAGNQGYADRPLATRNYHDLTILTHGTMYVDNLPSKFDAFSPADFDFLALQPNPSPRPGDPVFIGNVDQDPFTDGLGQKNFSHANPSCGGGCLSIGNDPGAGTDLRGSLAGLSEEGVHYLYAIDDHGELVQYTSDGAGNWTPLNVTANTRGPAIRSGLVAIDRAGSDTRDVYALNSSGHVIRYAVDAGSWTANDLTDRLNGPTISSDLVGFVEGSDAAEHVFLAGRSDNGQVVAYTGSGDLRWLVTRAAASGGLKTGLTAFGRTSQAGIDKNFVYGVGADGHLIEHIWNGRAWNVHDVSQQVGGPILVGGGLAGTMRREPTGLSRHVFGHDANGNVIHFSRGRRAGWEIENITQASQGPSTLGSLVVIIDPASSAAYVYSRKPSGVLVEFSEADSSWQSNGLRQFDATVGDLVGYADPLAATPERVLYGELPTNDFAVFDHDSDWHVEHVQNIDNLTSLAMSSL